MRPTNDRSARPRIALSDGAASPKLAAFSPSIDAMNQMGSPDQAQAQFDATITQAAYQRFGGRFPDLVPKLVTFRLLASDVEKGTAFGVFIVDLGGRVVYVPAVANDSRFEDLDIVYDKDSDQFAPLTLAQLRYFRSKSDEGMGTAQKLPESVPTDVDIRALVLPPETGRYSYASAPEKVANTAGLPAELEYSRPRTALQIEVLRHLAEKAPEVFEHLPESERALLQGGASPLAPVMAPNVPHGTDGPVPGTIRTASDIDSGLAAMIRKIASAQAQLQHKHASAPPKKLLTFLAHSPNAVKIAFAGVLRSNHDVAARAMRFYGPEKLAAACARRPEGLGILLSKRASVSEVPFRLSVAQTGDLVEAFGPDAGKALRGVALRGYYYRTEGLPPNQAITDPTTETVHVQRPASGQAGVGQTAVLMLRKRDGTREPALVISQPVGIDYKNAWDSQHVRQPDDRPSRYGDNGGTLRGGERVHVPSEGKKTLIVFGNGEYFVVHDIDVFGDPVPASVLEGTKLWEALASASTRQPSLGHGMFLSRSGENFQATEPTTIQRMSVGPDGVARGSIGDYEYGTRTFECDPVAAIEKITNTSSCDTLYVPASWRWIPLARNNTDTRLRQDQFYLSADDAASDLIHGLVGRTERASVLGDGITFATSAAPGMGKTKVAALTDLSRRYGLSGADAEALLKIAELRGKASALIVPRSGQFKVADASLDAAFGATLQDLQAQLQQLQGQIAALTSVQQRAQEMAAVDPMAMQQTDPGMGAPPAGDVPPDASAMPPGVPPKMDAGGAGQIATEEQLMAEGGGAPAPAPADPAMAAPPAAPPADPATAAAAPPADPAMAAAAPAGAPAVDPALAGMPPAAPPPPPPPPVDPQTGVQFDPATALAIDPQTGAPTGAMMQTEGPAASMVQSQVNPSYLASSVALDDAAIFDVGMLAEMQRAAAVSQSSAALEALLPIDTKDLGETVDDLGRALLNLYLRGAVLNEQLGVQTRAQMLGQIRRSFTGLGELLLDLRAYKAGARASSGLA